MHQHLCGKAACREDCEPRLVHVLVRDTDFADVSGLPVFVAASGVLAHGWRVCSSNSAEPSRAGMGGETVRGDFAVSVCCSKRSPRHAQ